MITELQERLFDVSTGTGSRRGYVPPSYEATERISTQVPSYVIRSFKEDGYQNGRNNFLNEGSGVLYQRKHWWDELDFNPKSIYENVKRHPLGTGAILAGLLGAASFAGYTATSIPYALTSGTAFATAGSLALGALFGGLFGLGVAGSLFYGWFRGRRKYINGKPNPQYNPKESRSLLKWLLDWVEERNIEAAQSLPRTRG